MMTTTTEMSIRDYATGTVLGSVPMPKEWADDYAAGAAPGFQWPEGIARAADVITVDVLDAWGIDHDATVYLD